MMTSEQRSLVKRLQQGDGDALQPLIKEFSRLTIRAAQVVVGNDWHLAEEIAQDSFFVVWKNLSQLKDCGSFRAWLWRITRNLALKQAKSSNSPPVPLSEAQDTGGRQPDPAQQASDRDQWSRMMSRVEKPFDQALALKAEGFEYQEILELVPELPCKTLDALRRRMKNILEQLKRQLTQEGMNDV